MYLEIDEGFPDHPKTMDFCGILENPEAWSHLIRLWRWACRCAPSGDLSGMKPRSIELAMGWLSLDGRAFAAAVESGFIDEEPDGRRTIHNWATRTGGAINKMAEEAARKKRWRAHKDGKCGGHPACEFCVREVGKRESAPSLSTGHDEEVTRTRRHRHEDATTQTSQDKGSPAGSDSVPPSPPSDPVSLLPFSLSSDPDPERVIPGTTEPALLLFPCDGTDKDFAVTETMRREHAEAFPSLDVMGEYRKALAWIKASPQNRKTARGMGKFLYGWLGRAQNSGAARLSQPARASPGLVVRNFKEEATADAFERARASRQKTGGAP